MENDDDPPTPAEILRCRHDRASDAQRVRDVVRTAVSDWLAMNCSPTSTLAEVQIAGVVMGSAIADRAAAQLAGSIGLTAEDRDVLQRMRIRVASLRDDWNGWPTEKTYAQELALLDRLLGVTP